MSTTTLISPELLQSEHNLSSEEMSNLKVYVLGYNKTNATMAKLLHQVPMLGKLSTHHPVSRALRFFTRNKLQNEKKRISLFPRMYYLISKDDINDFFTSEHGLMKTLKGDPLLTVLSDFDYSMLYGFFHELEANPLNMMEHAAELLRYKQQALDRLLVHDLNECKMLYDNKVIGNFSRAFREYEEQLCGMIDTIARCRSIDFSNDLFIKNYMIRQLTDNNSLPLVYYPTCP